MKKTLAVILCACMLVVAFGGCGSSSAPVSSSAPASEGAPAQSAAAHDPVIINFPTASASGALYAVGAAITDLWSTEIDYVNASSRASNGGIDNLNQVADGEAQVSIAISSNCYQSMNGTDSFTGAANEKLRVIAGLYFNPNQVVAT